jgi:hypothetical protein
MTSPLKNVVMQDVVMLSLSKHERGSRTKADALSSFDRLRMT